MIFKSSIIAHHRTPPGGGRMPHHSIFKPFHPPLI
jgi:hypothetical protein